MRKDVLANRYDGVVEAWKVTLIRSRARRFGIPRHEWPDIEQEIVLEVMAFRFDAAKAKGAQEATALTALIDNRLKMYLRRANARSRAEERNAVFAAARGAVGVPVDETGAASAALDVRRAVAAISPAEQAVCTALSRGASVRQIAAVRGCSRARVQRTVLDIRRHFERMGFGCQAAV